MRDNMITKEERINALKEDIKRFEEILKTNVLDRNFFINKLTFTQIALTVIEGDLIKYE
jgi:hypothetical protein